MQGGAGDERQQLILDLLQLRHQLAFDVPDDTLHAVAQGPRRVVDAAQQLDLSSHVHREHLTVAVPEG